MFNFLQHINTSRHVTSPKHETDPITSAAAAVVVVVVVVVIPGNRVGRVEYLEVGFYLVVCAIISPTGPQKVPADKYGYLSVHTC